VRCGLGGWAAVWGAAAALMCGAALAGTAPEAADRILPGQTVLVVGLRRPSQFWAALRGSELFRAVEAEPSANSWLQFGITAVTGTAQSQAGLKLGDFARDYARAASFAVVDLPAEGGQMPAVIVIEPPDKAPDLRALFTQTIEPALKERNPGITITSREAAGQAVTRVQQVEGEVPLSYFFRQNAVVLGRGPAIDRITQGQAREQLADVEGHRRCREAVAVDVGTEVHVNVKRLVNASEEGLRPARGAWPGLAASGLLSVERVAASSRIEGGRFQDKLYASTPNGRTGLLRLLDTAAAKADAAALPGWAAVLPVETAAVVGLRLRDGTELWEKLRQIADDTNGDWVADERAIRVGSAISLQREVVEALGGDLFVAWLRDGLVLGAQIRDPQRLQASLHECMLSQPAWGPGAQRETKLRKGAEVSIVTAPGKGPRVAYAVVSNHLLVASAPETVYAVLDADRSLAQEELFAKAYRELAREGALVAYLDPSKLASAMSAEEKRRFDVTAAAVLAKLSPAWLCLWTEPGAIRGRGSSSVGATTCGVLVIAWTKLFDTGKAER